MPNYYEMDYYNGNLVFPDGFDCEIFTFKSLKDAFLNAILPEEKEHVSFLRDYFGIQYQWTGDILDARFGLFHWFDSNPYIKIEYQRVTDNDSTTLQGSFENMLSNYDEQETR